MLKQVSEREREVGEIKVRRPLLCAPLGLCFAVVSSYILADRPLVRRFLINEHECASGGKARHKVTGWASYQIQWLHLDILMAL